jgi:hypothetical protein
MKRELSDFNNPVGTIDLKNGVQILSVVVNAEVIRLKLHLLK